MTPVITTPVGLTPNVLTPITVSRFSGTLASLAGQEHALTVLRRALGAGRLAHAYLFDGPPGVGKASTALGLGLALVCPASPREGCGVCDTCRRVLAGNHPDVLLFDAATLPELARASAEKSAVKYAARHIFPYALQPPHEAGARLLVIDNADGLSPDVQNTLLKTLEEPKAAVHIVLVTPARDRLLPTILSRTQRVRFVPVRNAVLKEIASRQEVAADRRASAAALAAGSVARLFQLLQAEGGPGPWSELEVLRNGAASTQVTPLFDAAASLGDKESKQRLPEVLALAAGFYRDVLVAALGAPELVLLGERGPEIERLAVKARAGGGLLRLRRTLRAVVEAEEALKGNANAVTALEHLMFEMRATERSAAG
jgi:DNA polymerase-3 subunit delta'